MVVILLKCLLLFLPLVAAAVVKVSNGNNTGGSDNGTSLNATYAALLLQNAQQAQELNAQFLYLALNDSCVGKRFAFGRSSFIS